MALSELIEMCEEGDITHYELFRVAQERGWGQHFEGVLKEEFEEWCRTHPETGDRTFTIQA